MLQPTWLALASYLSLFVALGTALAAPAAAHYRVIAGSTATLAAGCALAASLITPAAGASIAAGGVLCWAARCAPRPALRQSALALLGLWALLAGFHALPGFTPIQWANDFGRQGQLPLRWHLDKALGGLLLLLALPRAAEPVPWRARLALCPIATLALLALAWASGLAQPDPRWLPHLALWLAGNLFLTVIAEEAFFRGLLQGALQSALAPWPQQAYPLALTLGAVLFGAVHLAWGLPFATFALLAGLLYGAMAGAGRHLGWAVLTHFTVNAATVILLRSPLG